MNDRELLELAAKAAGIKYTEHNGTLIVDFNGVGYEAWNPLNRDDQALRLAVKLRMRVYVGTHTVVAEICSDSDEPPIYVKVFIETEPCSATRRAIIRAAAEIGKAI